MSGLYGLVLGTALPYESLYLAHRFGAGAATIGGLSTAAGGVMLPLQIAGGHLSDRVGRKRLIVIGLLSAAVGCIGLAAAPNLVVAAFGLFLVGASIALLWPVTRAMVGDLAAPEMREHDFAWLYAVPNAGFAVGPIAGGLLAGYSYLLLFSAAGCLALVAAAVALTLTETVGEVHANRSESSRTHVWQDSHAVILCLLTFSIWLAGGQLLVTVPLWVVRDLGFPNILFGVMIALNGTLIGTGQVVLTNQIIRFPTPVVLAIGAFMTGLGFGLMIFHSVPTLLFGVGFLSVGEMLLVPITSAALDRLAPAGRRGQYQGAGAFMQSVGVTVGSLPGGVLLQVAGGLVLWPICLAWSIATGAGYLALQQAERRQKEPIV